MFKAAKEEIKKQLIDSKVNSDIIETKKLNKKAGKAERPEDDAAVVKQYKDIIRTKKKNIISIAYHQRSVQKIQGEGKVHQTSQWV